MEQASRRYAAVLGKAALQIRIASGTPGRIGVLAKQLSSVALESESGTVKLAYCLMGEADLASRSLGLRWLRLRSAGKLAMTRSAEMVAGVTGAHGVSAASLAAVVVCRCVLALS